MVIDFSKIDCKENPVLVLRNLNGTAIQTLGYAFDISVSYAYNELSELQFSLPAYVNGEKTPHYDDVVGMRIVDVRSPDTGDGKIHGYGQFILVDPSEESNGVRRVKTCKAYSLEYEFQKKNITLTEGTYNFYSPDNMENTIIGRILEKMPDWKIGHIDTDLIGRYRTFDVTEDIIYNFIKSDVQETYGCIFDFDTYERRINVVSVENEPETKPIYLSPERLIKQIEIDEDSDSIVTCVDVSGADGVTIRSVNPTGTNKIYNLDYFMNTGNFSQELIDKWNNWVELCDKKRDEYYNLTMEYNLVAARLTAEQSNLSELDNQLDSYNHVLSTKVQAVSEGLISNSDKEYENARKDVTDAENKIADKKREIAAIQTASDKLISDLKDINEMCKMETFFAADELSTLQKYFIEGSIQDDSFSATMVKEYGNANINQSITDGSLSVTKGAELTHAVSGTQLKNMDTIRGGHISVTMNTDRGTTETFSGTLVKSTSEFTPDGTGNTGGSFIYTAVLENGTNIDGEFTSGRLTLIGDCENYKYTEYSGDANTPNGKLSYDISACTLYFTKDVTEYEKHSIEWGLYEYGKQVLDEKSKPTYTFSIDSGNFLYADDFVSFKNALRLGKRVYLKLGDDEDVITPYVVGVEWNFEDPSSFTLEFSDTYTSSDHSFKLAKLLEQSVSMGKKLDLKSGAYNSFVNSGASTFVKEFMGSALDIAKNRVLSSGNQAIEFGDAGIRVRQWADNNHTSYDDEQLWIVDNMIAFTTDNWATSNMAIGKIFDENIIGADGTKGATAYGIAAPYLVGTVLAGRSLVIDTEDGSFRVDSNGVTLDSLNLNIISSTNDGTGLTFSADEGLKHVVKKTSNGRTHTYEAGFSATNDNGEGYGLYFMVDGDKKLYFDVDKPELVVDGSIWAREIFLGNNRKSLATLVTNDYNNDAIRGECLDLKNILVKDDRGNVRFEIDGNGREFNVYNGNFHMTNGYNTIDINADNGLLFTQDGNQVVKLDITNGNATFTGIVEASTINGGTINGSIINTNQEATIGQTLRLVNGSNNNFFATISAGGPTGDRLVIQASDRRTIEIDGGSIVLNGNVSVNNSSIATWADLNTLSERIDMLQRAIQNLQSGGQGD